MTSQMNFNPLNLSTAFLKFSNSISDWSITWYLYVDDQSESILWIFRFTPSKIYTTILTIYLIGLKIDTSIVLTNRQVVLRGSNKQEHSANIHYADICLYTVQIMNKNLNLHTQNTFFPQFPSIIIAPLNRHRPIPITWQTLLHI